MADPSRDSPPQIQIRCRVCIEARRRAIARRSHAAIGTLPRLPTSWLSADCTCKRLPGPPVD